MNRIIYLLIFFAGFSATLRARAGRDSMSEDSLKVMLEQESLVKNFIDSLESSFHYETGTVVLGANLATLMVPDGFKYLDAEQSNYVLTEIWGNPPRDCLGMLFPENISPVSNDFTYAVEISYSEDGYIEDDDAKSIDYDDLLKQMKEDIIRENKEREVQGYSTYELVGWASDPFYDEENKKLHWAKELKFDDSDINTLNYNIRILGRKGYLNLNAIGDITILPQVQHDINAVLASVNFNDGYQYDDFSPGIDKVAAYGIGGLIAGKVLAKTGFLALLAKFGKVIAVGILGLFATLRKRIFGSSRDSK